MWLVGFCGKFCIITSISSNFFSIAWTSTCSSLYSEYWSLKTALYWSRCSSVRIAGYLLQGKTKHKCEPNHRAKVHQGHIVSSLLSKYSRNVVRHYHRFRSESSRNMAFHNFGLGGSRGGSLCVLYRRWDWHRLPCTINNLLESIEWYKMIRNILWPYHILTLY